MNPAVVGGRGGLGMTTTPTSGGRGVRGGAGVVLVPATPADHHGLVTHIRRAVTAEYSTATSPALVPVACFMSFVSGPIRAFEVEATVNVLSVVAEPSSRLPLALMVTVCGEPAVF